MTETAKHFRVRHYGWGVLSYFFADRPDVYVASDLMVYPYKANRKRSVAPDIFVAIGVPKLPDRDIYQTWVEGERRIVFVMEIVSRSTRRRDQEQKKRIYARMRVREYFLFDPKQRYLQPPFQGYRLRRRRYLPIEPDAHGRILASSLGLRIEAVNDELRFYDAITGVRVHDEAGTERLARIAANIRIVEISAAAEARVAEAEARAEQERTRAEQERTRAEQERTRAEQERTRAEQERTHAAEAEARAAEQQAQTEALLTELAELRRRLGESSP